MSAARCGRRVAAILSLAMLVSACTVGVDLQRPVVERQRFVMDVERIGGHEAREGAPTLTLGPVRMSPEFEHRSFVYRIDDRRYEGDFYNQWFTSPRDQVARVAASWFSGGTVFGELIPPAMSSSAEYRLDLSVTALFWDLRDADRFTAEVTLEGHLTRLTNAGRVVVTKAEGSASQVVTGAGVDGRVQAMEQALAGAFRTLEDSLARAIAEPGSGP